MPHSRRMFLGALMAGGALSSARRLPAEAVQPAGKSYRACVIGHTGRGGYGHGLDVCFQKIPGVTVAAVADPDEKGRAKAIQVTGAGRSYADWREMLEREKPDLVSIGMRWVENRLALVKSAVEAGAHVFMEKPMAASLEEADAILAAARERGRHIVLAFHARSAPSVLHLKKLVDEGFLGDLLEIRSRGKEDHRAGGEDLMVLGTHCLYLMRLFAGDPLWCSARVTTAGRDVTRADARQGTEPLGPIAGDTVHASYAFRGGVQGHFASQKLSKGPGGRFQLFLHGSKGVAVIHIGMDPEIFHLPDPLWSPGKSGAAWQPLPGAPSKKEPHGLTGQEAANHRLVLGLIEAGETGQAPPAAGEEGRAVLEMILAVYDSHLRGGRAAFPLERRKHPLLSE